MLVDFRFGSKADFQGDVRFWRKAVTRQARRLIWIFFKAFPPRDA
jgi:hypothetical protein